MIVIERDKTLLVVLAFLSSLHMMLAQKSIDELSIPWNVILEQLLAGPLGSKQLMAFFDQNLTIDETEVITQLLSNHSQGVVISTVNKFEAKNWLQRQRPQNVKGPRLTHIFFINNNFEEFIFEESDLKWNPDYLILFSLGDRHFQDLFQQEAILRVKKLILLQCQPHGIVYTYLPFKKQVQTLGRWSSMTFKNFDDIFRDRYPSFDGYTFHLATWFDDKPYIFQSRSGPKGEGEGVEIEMLNALCKVLNFSYTITEEPSDMKWGAYENGTWNGMLGMVYRKEKNFTVNFFVITDQRRAAFDSTVSYWNEGFGISMLAPPPFPRWKNFYYPFTAHVWMGLFLTFIISVVFYQIFIGFWFLFCMVVALAYTANLIAFLTVPLYPKRIQTVEQLALSHYGISMYDYGEFVPGALASSTDPMYRRIRARLELYPTYAEAVYPMLNGTHAHVESFSYNRIANNSYMLKEQLFPGHLCWYFQKNTPYVYKFDDGIQRLVDSGLVNHWLT
ncbi:Ionotropic receptor 119, partial [Hyalella azteca]